MDHYIDIRLRPDPEFPANLLMNALFSKLHRGLAEQAQGNIGVSFPEEGKGRLGASLRLHGSAVVLADFMARAWLTGMHDHVSIGAVAPVPADARHRGVRRVQAKASPERARRRLLARKGVSGDEALALIPDRPPVRLDLPYIELASRSTGQRFLLFIKHLPFQDAPVAGRFSAYGLSPTATVPSF